MSHSTLVQSLYQGFLHREPRPAELESWSQRLANGLTPQAFAQALLACDEFAGVRRKVRSLFVAPGHFYSPIVDVEQVRARYGSLQPDVAPTAVKLDAQALHARWDELLPFLRDIPFSEDADPACRYHFRNPAFGYGDGSILHAMLRRYRPRRLVEVGSGYSSACSIETIDRYLDGAVDVSFVEPYPALLLKLLGDERAARCTIHASGVQDTDPAVFTQLEAGDFLFIDSTHVMKTGSDVCHELFNVLPALQSGVFVHFHDIFWPFEYGPNWIVKENRSWNEIYGLRAFLMYNDAFEIVFFNDWFARTARDRIQADYPPMLKNTGGSIWLRKR
jgi:hypothetical protein